MQNQQSRRTRENLSNLTADPGAITEELVKVAINKTSEVREISSLSNQSHKILHVQKPTYFVHRRRRNTRIMPLPDRMNDSAAEVSTTYHCYGVLIKGMKSIGISCSAASPEEGCCDSWRAGSPFTIIHCGL